MARNLGPDDPRFGRFDTVARMALSPTVAPDPNEMK
jgi:hypothetical protein